MVVTVTTKRSVFLGVRGGSLQCCRGSISVAMVTTMGCHGYSSVVMVVTVFSW